MGVQVVAVLAHELGHWKLGHTKALMALQQVVALSQFMLFAVVRSSPHLLAAFGFSTRRPVIVSLLLFSMVSGPLDKLIGWLFNLLSRRCAPSPPPRACAPFSSLQSVFTTAVRFLTCRIVGSRAVCCVSWRCILSATRTIQCAGILCCRCGPH